MTSMRAFPFLAIVSCALASCEQVNYDNQYDPASAKYVPFERLPVTDFEDPLNKGKWGWEQFIYPLQGGRIDHEYVVDVVGGRRSRVLKLHYFQKDSVQWVGALEQRLGGPDLARGDTLTFSLETMRLKNVILSARGETGKEKISVVLFDLRNRFGNGESRQLDVEYRRLTIPLEPLKMGGIDPTRVFGLEVAVGLIDPNSPNVNEGTVYLDDIAFEW